MRIELRPYDGLEVRRTQRLRRDKALVLKQVTPPGLSRWKQAFALPESPVSGAAGIVQKPVNHGGKPGGGRKFACLKTTALSKLDFGVDDISQDGGIPSARG